MRPMKKLRMAFFEKDIEYEDAITEIYAICNMANIPYEKIPEYFPPTERS